MMVANPSLQQLQLQLQQLREEDVTTSNKRVRVRGNITCL
jgi:hypothetical protein